MNKEMDIKRKKNTSKRIVRESERIRKEYMEHIEHIEYRDRKRPAHNGGGHRGTKMTQRARAQIDRQVDTHT